MAIRLGELAQMVAGTCIGDSQVELSGAATLSDAQAGDVTFIDSPQRMLLLGDVRASALLAPRSMEESLVTWRRIPIILVDDILSAFAAVVMYFRPPPEIERCGQSPQAIISPRAAIAANVDIHPGAFVAEDVEIAAGCVIHSGVRILPGCRIAQDVTIYPNAVLYEGTLVGPRCTIHAGAVLGAHGFGYRPVNGRHERGLQLGNVVLGADVDIGAGTTIDRGTYGPTRIGEGTKIDNQVMIGHNCRVGKHNLICAQAGIAGSSTTGDYVVVAGQAGIRDHVTIGDRAVLGGKCGVTNDVAPDEQVLGAPALPIKLQKLIFAAQSKLPEMRREFKALEKEVARLAEQLQPALPLPANRGGATPPSDQHDAAA